MKFSFIIPCFNEEDDIEEVIRACLYQKSEAQFEILLINDGSTDRTKSIIDEYCNAYDFIKGFHFKENHGVCNARNYGAKYAEGDVLIFLNADELPEENFLSKIIVKYSNGADYFMPLTEVRNVNSFYGEYREVYRKFKYPHPNNYLWSQGFSCRKEAFTCVGGFNERYPGCGGEDWDFVSKLEMKGLNRCVDFNVVVKHNVPHRAKDIIWHMFNRGRGTANFDFIGRSEEIYNYILFEIILIFLFFAITIIDIKIAVTILGYLLFQNLLIIYKMKKSNGNRVRYLNITLFYFAEKFLRLVGYHAGILYNIKNRGADLNV